MLLAGRCVLAECEPTVLRKTAVVLMLATRAVVRALALPRIERRDPHTSKVAFGLCNWLRRHGLQQQRRRRTGCCLATRLWLDEFEIWRGVESHPKVTAVLKTAAS